MADKLGAGVHTLACKKCGKRFRYRRKPGRPGSPRRNCFTCMPAKTDLYVELPLDPKAEAILDLFDQRPGYRERVEGWLTYLRDRHDTRVPAPPHGDEHFGSCAPCDALRLLRLERQTECAERRVA